MKNNQNFYEQKLFEIQKLIKNNEKEQALKILNEELDLPYVPLQYETIFNHLLSQLIFENQAQVSKNTAINPETFLELIKSHNQLQVARALDSMSKINLHSIAKQLKIYIEDVNYDHRTVKIYMLESMAQQKIDLKIKFENQTINLLQMGSIFDNPQVTRVFKEIENLTIQNPSLANLAHQNLKSYLLINYPIVNFESNLAQSLIKITQHMLGQIVSLNNQEIIIFNQIKSLNNF